MPGMRVDKNGKVKSSNFVAPHIRGLVRTYARKGMLAHDIAEELSLNAESVRRCLINFVPDSDKNISHGEGRQKEL